MGDLKLEQASYNKMYPRKQLIVFSLTKYVPCLNLSFLKLDFQDYKNWNVKINPWLPKSANWYTMS